MSDKTIVNHLVISVGNDRTLTDEGYLGDKLLNANKAYETKLKTLEKNEEKIIL